MRNNKLVMNISPLTAVTTHADRLVAVEQLAGVQTLRRDITEHYAGLKAPATQTTRALNAAEKAHLAPVLEAETLLQDILTTYDRAQEEAVDQAALQALTEGTPVPAYVAPPKLAGEKRQTHYRGVCTNLRALVEAGAAGDADLGCIVAHQPTLNKIARRDREQFRLAGCELATTTQVITR